MSEPSDLERLRELEDPEWIAAMEKPATRGELLQALTMIRLAFLGQGFMNIRLIDGTEEQQRREGERALEIAEEITALTKRFVKSWSNRE